MEEKTSETKRLSRRKILRKVKRGAIFAVPTLVTFKISKLHAWASDTPEAPDW